MAANEDQAQFVVMDLVGFGHFGLRFGYECDVGQGGRHARLPAPTVDDPESPSRDQPGSRVGGNPATRPLLGRACEGFVHGLLGGIKAAEEADQRCKDAPTLGPVKGYKRAARLSGHSTGLGWPKSTSGLTSTAPIGANG